MVSALTEFILELINNPYIYLQLSPKQHSLRLLKNNGQKKHLLEVRSPNYFCSFYFQNVGKLTQFQRFPCLSFFPSEIFLAVTSSECFCAFQAVLPRFCHLFHHSGYIQGIVLFHMGSVIPLSRNPSQLLFFFNIKPRELIVHLCVIINSIKPYGLVRLSNILNITPFFTGSTLDN